MESIAFCAIAGLKGFKTGYQNSGAMRPDACFLSDFHQNVGC